MMRLSLNILFLGWCLAEHLWLAKAQSYLTISVSPSVVIVQGRTVSISCKIKDYPQAALFLFQNSVWKSSAVKTAQADGTVFSILKAQHSDEGTYKCGYCPSYSQPCSLLSEGVNIYVRESYLIPSISVFPSVVIAQGGNVNIFCKHENYPRAEFFLYQASVPKSSAVKKAQADGTVFFISKAQLSDEGTYYCGYCPSTSYGQPCLVLSEGANIYVIGSYLIPSISVHPSVVIVQGGNVSISCRSQNYSPAEFLLYQFSFPKSSAVKKAQADGTEFSISKAQLSDAGTYYCGYCPTTIYGQPCLVLSEGVGLYVRDPSLPKPSIMLRSREEGSPGWNVTINCQGPEDGLTFSLHKSRGLIASRTAEPDTNTAAFSLFMVRLEDLRNYTCQYHFKENPFVWSEASEPLELVREGSMTTIIWASCAAGLLLLVLLLLLLALAFVLHRKRKKGSSVNEINQPVSMSLEPNAEADPNGVSYAVLSHHSPTAKTAAKPDSIPESCVYATVAKNRTMED